MTGERSDFGGSDVGRRDSQGAGGYSQERTIVVGTRQSALALQQTGQVMAGLQEICREQSLTHKFAIHKMVTQGDRILDVSLAKVGGKGLFVKEIEQALLDGTIDLAVHSMKDMPAQLPEGLVIGAVPLRVDARDALITRDGRTLAELPEGAVVGTSSLRRAAQLRELRPDVRIESLRGNIDTRLRKLDEGQYDGIILAAAGLMRMGWAHRISEYLPVDTYLPAVAQGALALQCRASDAELLQLLKFYHDPESGLRAEAERAFLAQLNGGCQLPIGGYATWNESSRTIRMAGLVADADGSRFFRHEAEGSDPYEVGRGVADTLIAAGAGELLQTWKG